SPPHHVFFCSLLCHRSLYSFLLITPPPPNSTLFPYTTLFRSIQTYFGCHLISEACVHLLESLVGTWSIHPIVPECAANAHRYLWQPIVVKVKAARNSVVTNVIGIDVGRGIKLALQGYFRG